MPDDPVTLTLPRETADRLYDLLGETPHDDEHAWTFAVSVPLADALGYHVPAWVREKAAIHSIARHARERFMPSLDRTPTTPYGTWICSLHGRWVEIRKPEGDTLRPCPECPPGYPSPKIKSGRPLTGLTS